MSQDATQPQYTAAQLKQILTSDQGREALKKQMIKQRAERYVATVVSHIYRPRRSYKFRLMLSSCLPYNFGR
jgi:hypothetical protein